MDEKEIRNIFKTLRININKQIIKKSNKLKMIISSIERRPSFHVVNGISRRILIICPMTVLPPPPLLPTPYSHRLEYGSTYAISAQSKSINTRAIWPCFRVSVWTNKLSISCTKLFDGPLSFFETLPHNPLSFASHILHRPFPLPKPSQSQIPINSISWIEFKLNGV